MEIKMSPVVLQHKRRGRGIGSGKGGHTVGFGQKGQGSRGSRKTKITSEGGNIPLFRKLPNQKGFKSVTAKPATIALKWLNAHTKNGQTVDAAFFVTNGVVQTVAEKVKIVGNETFNQKIKVKGIALSKAAKEAIEKAGGEVIA